MMTAAVAALVLLFSGCVGRTETARYTSTTIPPWILKEWSNAQDELLELPDLTQDPRRFGPYEWDWIQLDSPFYFTDETGKRELLRGLTQWKTHQIIICCGDRSVVRHEAFHAILMQMDDTRFMQHYPDLRKGRLEDGTPIGASTRERSERPGLSAR